MSDEPQVEASRPDDVPLVVIDPLAQRQARAFMMNTYAFDVPKQSRMILQVIEHSALPDELSLERFNDDLDAFMTAVERLAGVPSIEELAGKYRTLQPAPFAAYLYGLQSRGELPRWVVPYFNYPEVEPGFEEELRQRVITRLMR